MNAFKTLLAFRQEFFKDNESNELMRILQNAKSVLAELHKAVAIAASLPQKAVDHVKNLHQDLLL